jgi:restriction endonuclease
MIAAETIRYIKLGRNGSWERASLDSSELHFGFQDAPHELSLTGDFDRIRQHLIERGRDPRSATRDAREICEFYQLDERCLWVTFAREHLWWAFAAPGVTWLGGDGLSHGERSRNVIGRWSNRDLKGNPLTISRLSTRLTKVAGYRRTICSIEASDYLLRRINAVDEPLLAKCMMAREEILVATQEAIRELHWRDFETLVDLIFTRSGWNRVSAIGGTQKLLDLEIEQPITKERAAVQVKSQASQRTLDDYIRRVDEAAQFRRFFFVCHSPQGTLKLPEDRDNIHLHTDRELAEAVHRTGLYDWVLEKITL